MNRKQRIAILGAGPAGLEAALYARALGYAVTVLEKGEQAGANVRRWGFVELFTPWEMNVSPLGLAALERQGVRLPSPSEYPTGEELVEEYLRPIANSLGESFRSGVEVLDVSRAGVLKPEEIGGARRETLPFRLLARRVDGLEEELAADLVIDATGVYDSPNALGDGGAPALGERAAAGSIRYHLVDVAGSERESFKGKTTLLIGAGFSAATSLVSLLEVLEQDPRGRLIWARRSTGPEPLPTFQDDPLPLRARLAKRGNAVAATPPARCRVISGVTVHSIQSDFGVQRVALRTVDGEGIVEVVNADHVLASVGYRPNLELFRELHVHQCYASEGPMQLAAALLAESGAGGDCLEQAGRGIETLRNPEPGFFILGGKSYGRRNDYLMRVGREQIRDLFRYLENRPDLDLYSGRPRERNTPA